MVLGCKMPLTQQIVVYDRNIVRLSKIKFLWQYGAIKHMDIVIKEMKYKWWQANYLAKWMLATCTIRSFIERLSNEDIAVSYGTVISVWHFFCYICIRGENCVLLMQTLFESQIVNWACDGSRQKG